MKIAIAAAAAMLLAASTTHAGDTPASSSAQKLEQLLSQGGLQRADIKGIDLAYQRAGASLAGYRKVLLGPVQVSFARGFERSSSLAHAHRVSPAEMQKIRERLIAVLREEASATLTEGGYQVVEAPGDGVLGVSVAIVNLYITAPDLPSTAGVRTYAVSAGEMTLVSELSDSQSGEIIVRAYDREEAHESITAHRITATENRMEARKIARDWATILRAQLDAANASMVATPSEP